MTTPAPVPSAGLDRFGHLPELAFDRLLLDNRSTDPAFFAAAEAHLAQCEQCRAAFAELRAEDSSFHAAASLRKRPDRSTGHARVGRMVAIATATLALAAGLLIALRPGPEPRTGGGYGQPFGPSAGGFDPGGLGLRAKGGALELEVHVHDGVVSRTVDNHSVVHPGERAGFGVRVDRAGFLLVLGWDQRGQAYVLYPPAADAATPAAAVSASDAVVALPVAARFDATLGEEHLAAVFCETPFALSDLAPQGHIDPPAIAARPGCALRRVTLDKRPVE